MPAWLCILALALAFASPASPEGPEDHARMPRRTITFDNERIMPPSLTLEPGEVLVLENFSLTTMEVTFVEPPDAVARIRCGLIGIRESRPPWAVFDVRDDQLVATIPPGRFGSVCSLAPGRYAYVVKRLGAQPLPVGGELRDKGQITVR